MLTVPVRKLAGIAILAVSALVGCAQADPQLEADLARAFSSTKNPLGLGLPKEQATCAAKVYAESDLSDEYLQALAAGKRVKASAADQGELTKLGAKLASECLAS